jgi:MraZ protein
VLRGRVPAKIDDKGRLKVPASFRQLIHDKHGSDIYVTSLDGQSVLLYPMPVWVEIENQFATTPASALHPAVQKFMKITSFYGSATEMDSQGRVLIQSYLRDSAQMTGDVDVIGAQSYLEVWNHDRCLSSVHGNPLTDDDKRALAEIVSAGKAQRT